MLGSLHLKYSLSPLFSPFPLLLPQAAEKKDKMEKDDEERSQRMIELQISKALASKKEVSEDEASRR